MSSPHRHLRRSHFHTNLDVYVLINNKKNEKIVKPSHMLLASTFLPLRLVVMVFHAQKFHVGTHVLLPRGVQSRFGSVMEA